MKLISGVEVAGELLSSLRIDVDELKAAGVAPKLAVVMVGDDPASQVYVRNKKRRAHEVGIMSVDVDLPGDVSFDELKKCIISLNSDVSVHAILVQLPLPEGLSKFTLDVISLIDPEKDVDCFHPVNVGRLSYNSAFVAPCTPSGVVHLIKSTGLSLPSRHAVIIGRSNVVGRPVAQLLLNNDCSVTVVHSKTVDLAGLCRGADILVSAVGRQGLVTREFVKPGAVVIDVGISRTDAGLVGDVKTHEVAEVAAAVTPVPGGVGPMTIAYLLYNTVQLAMCRKRGSLSG